ncbi:MAG TPA: CDF family Co(II)/Ni(II) efflux transporter DmeF [Gammaproteobacteria bacterium]|nr:CDF family Co(II)/Ni(II) efflux transporter DmeF [Gammaproteobacteria bacterium]
MHESELNRWRHSHSFGQDRKRPGERKTFIVIALTGTMMVVEVGAGIAFGSMALLADGLHMASHAVALGINAFAYVYARRHAEDPGYTFGTGKANTLGGFTGAVLLAGFALVMAGESVVRLTRPVAIAFDQAIFVAVIGLLVNGLSVLVLEHRRSRPHALRRAVGRGQEHDHDPTHAHDHGDDHAHGHGHDHGHDHDHDHDHNLVSAYLHVLADALTSVLAIFALLAAKYWGFAWMDPVMGIVGAVLVARWSIGLLRATTAVLLDKSAPESVCAAIRASIEGQADNRIADLHVWSVGPGMYSALISVVTHAPRSPESYKRLIPPGLGVVHAAIEVHACGAEEGAPAKGLAASSAL